VSHGADCPPSGRWRQGTPGTSEPSGGAEANSEGRLRLGRRPSPADRDRERDRLRPAGGGGGGARRNGRRRGEGRGRGIQQRALVVRHGAPALRSQWHEMTRRGGRHTLPSPSGARFLVAVVLLLAVSVPVTRRPLTVPVPVAPGDRGEHRGGGPLAGGALCGRPLPHAEGDGGNSLARTGHTPSVATVRMWKTGANREEMIWGVRR